MKKKRPTAWQVSMALQYQIPMDQAHTISNKKASEYFKHCKTPESRLEWFLNFENTRRTMKDRSEWMGGKD